MMQMVGSFAEFERAVIPQRTSAGMAAARAGWRRVAGPPSDGELSGGDCRSQPR
jgi:DNA invertase Pin-like site-specific DNA recombinase